MASCMPKQSSQAKGDAAPAQPSGDVDIDPKLEWHDAATGYVLRLALPGFKKDDFKVQVDAGGRLTVRGERPAGYVRFHKAFQLPLTANLDAVAGRFDGNVLSLTVPKKKLGAAAMLVAQIAESECAAATAAAARDTKDKDDAAAAAAGLGKGQMIAAAVGGFALGVFVAHRILSAANS